MKGDDRVRHCTHCAKNVYNISNMSRQEAADLIESTEGRVCVRYYTRPDGAIMTRDCGKSIRLQVRFMTVVATVLGIFGLGTTSVAQQPPKQDGVKPKDYGVRRPGMTMGRISHTMGVPSRPRNLPRTVKRPLDISNPKTKASMQSKPGLAQSKDMVNDNTATSTKKTT